MIYINEKWAAIYEAVRDGNESAPDIANKTSYDTRRVRETLFDMHRKGYITRIERGRYKANNIKYVVSKPQASLSYAFLHDVPDRLLQTLEDLDVDSDVADFVRMQRRAGVKRSVIAKRANIPKVLVNQILDRRSEV